MDVVSAGDYTYVLWEPTLHLPRPRARLQRPAIYFTAHLTPTSKALITPVSAGSKPLKSFEPLPANVLEPLRFDQALGESNIYLSEARITKYAPTATKPQDDVKPIRGASKRAFPVVPALFTRIRYSALPDSVVASLHLETTQAVSDTVEIKDIALDVPDAAVKSLCPLETPKQSRPGDETILLYRLTWQDKETSPAPATVFVKIEASVALEEGFVDLEIKWQAQVDLSQTMSKPTYKWSRPLSGTKQLPVRPSSESAARPPSIDINQASSSEDSGVTFSFQAARKIKKKKVFNLEVLCVNNSTRVRRFALVVLQPKRPTATDHSDQDSRGTDKVSGLFDAPERDTSIKLDAIDLNPDVRMGPIPPGACFEMRMKFKATRYGPLDLGVVRIVDLDTRQTVDVRELPDIIAVKKVPKKPGEESSSDGSDDSDEEDEDENDENEEEKMEGEEGKANEDEKEKSEADQSEKVGEKEKSETGESERAESAKTARSKAERGQDETGGEESE